MRCRGGQADGGKKEKKEKKEAAKKEIKRPQHQRVGKKRFEQSKSSQNVRKRPKRFKSPTFFQAIPPWQKLFFAGYGRNSSRTLFESQTHKNWSADSEELEKQKKRGLAPQKGKLEKRAIVSFKS